MKVAVLYFEAPRHLLPILSEIDCHINQSQLSGSEVINDFYQHCNILNAIPSSDTGLGGKKKYGKERTICDICYHPLTRLLLQRIHPLPLFTHTHTNTYLRTSCNWNFGRISGYLVGKRKQKKN
jgi:hypothetical protein